MKRWIRITIGLLVVVGLLVGGVGSVQATHDNPNWGTNPGDGNTNQPGCSVGHINPHDDGTTRAAADDCGINRGNA